MTPRQVQVLDFVRHREEQALPAPTMQEIAGRLRLASKSGAWKVVQALVEQGQLTRQDRRHGGLRLAGMPDLRTATTNALRAELARRGETIGALHRPERATGRRVSCAADTCGVAVRRGHLFCLDHWRALPRELQNNILAAHRAGDSGRYQELVARARDIADRCGGVL